MWFILKPFPSGLCYLTDKGPVTASSLVNTGHKPESLPFHSKPRCNLRPIHLYIMLG